MKTIGRYLFVALAAFLVVSSANAGDHQLFDRVLRDHVEHGKVDYPAIGSDVRFQQYLEYLAVTDPESFVTRDEKLAFWINAYNAFAIKGILNGLSPNGFFSRISFFKTDVDLAGRKIDLYDLEREIIIPFGEPRIHFAIVCAAVSCPKLASEAYTAASLERQLERNTRAFINNMTKNRFDHANRSGRVSKIFDWFPKDFEMHSHSVQQFLGKYVDDPVIAQSLLRKEYELGFMDYDWTLNGSNPA